MEKKSQQEPSYFRMIQTEDGEVPFLQDIWGFFSKKGIKTQFYSFFSDKSFKVDLEVCESLGCPIHIYVTEDELVAKWETIKSTLKTRKIADEDKEKAWLQGLEKKWILPKNLLVKKTPIEWTTLKAEVETLSDNRCDILKIEGKNDLEHVLLYSMLESGFRPGIVLVRYTEDPDANVPSMLVAGHLQMSGYKLAEVTDKWFLYLYTDICLYESCSWRNTKTQNPVALYLADLFSPKPTTETQKVSEETPKKEESKQEESDENKTRE
jgi:hypothetical protein